MPSGPLSIAFSRHIPQRRFVHGEEQVAAIPDGDQPLPVPGDVVAFAIEGRERRFEVLYRFWRYDDPSRSPDLDIHVVPLGS